jgi:D-psicose/D-tagatose/L-ribulose 3-epimerase
MEPRPPLGVCTWTFGQLPLTNIARRISVLELDGVELFGDLSAYSAAEASQIVGDQGLAIFSLTPDNVDLAHPESSTRQQAIDYYLALLDFAAELGNPIVSCHGFVGRVRPLSSLVEERQLLVLAVSQIAERAQALGLRLVIEVLNRYESHLINTGAEAVIFVQDVGMDNVGVLLDAYHMNIEEADPAGAIREVGEKLWLYHAADSNRQGIGRGHTDFGSQLIALSVVGYEGPIIFESTAPGPDPFTAIKDEESLMWLEDFLGESKQWVLKAISQSDESI